MDNKEKSENSKGIINEVFSNKFFEFVKNYPALILIVFTVLGGLLQFIQLSLISFSYIRFFSLSQIIPDGIFMLISLFTYLIILALALMICIPVLGFSIGKIDKKNKFYLEQIFKFRKIAESTSVILIFFSIFSGAIFFYMFTYLINKKTPNFNVSYFFSHTIIIVLFFYILYYFYLIGKKWLRIVCELLIYITLFFIFLFFLMSITSFARTNLMPNNNINFKNLIHKIKIKNPNSNPEILYFNDKYIFVDVRYSKHPNKPKYDTIQAVQIYKLDDIIVEP